MNVVALGSDWTLIDEDKEIWAMDDGDRVRVSIQDEEISEEEIVNILLNLGIKVGRVVWEAGEAENESVGFFEKF